MLNLLLGGAILGASIYVFWLALPSDGTVRPWITPRREPYVVVGMLVAAAYGLFLVVLGAKAILA
ncbi:MAG: hypothetical protein K0R61_5049 [Microvirga sp.]|jgi:hypothetical protein|nr:hypothetical protein [Microvirga sp.]